MFFNPVHNKVEVVNYSAGDRAGLKVVTKVPENITDVYFLRLFIYSAEGEILSENLYWQGKQEGNFQAVRTAAKADVE